MDNSPPPYQQQQNPYYGQQNPYFGQAQPQQPAGPPVLLIILCILTLLGSLYSVAYNSIAGVSALGSGGFYIEDGYGSSWIFYIPIPLALLALGKLISAILLLMRRKAGLYLYTVSEVLSMILLLVSAVGTMMFYNSLGGLISDSQIFAGYSVIEIIKTVFSALFSVLFVILYWTQRKHLR